MRKGIRKVRIKGEEMGEVRIQRMREGMNSGVKRRMREGKKEVRIKEKNA